MFLITNRQIIKDQGAPAILGEKPNIEGPFELRLVEATKREGRWHLKVLPDKPTAVMKREVGLDVANPNVASSQYVAAKVFAQVNPRRAHGARRKQGKNLLFFVHGFNNDVKVVLDRADSMARTYGVEVVAFTWPANGGGGLHGVASYKRDKRDAKASIGALDRVLAMSYEYLNAFNKKHVDDICKTANERYKNNAEARDQFIAKMTEKGCPFRVTMMAHSMGNYIYKHLLKSGASEGNNLLFDNVVLVAADTNSAHHAQWVDNIRCRSRVYVTINENDSALLASRMKSGQEQLARLGHYPYNLNSRQTVYVQFTDESRVGKSHAYFEKGPIKNARVKKFFDRAFNGERAETGLCYDSATGMYRFR